MILCEIWMMLIRHWFYIRYVAISMHKTYLIPCSLVIERTLIYHGVLSLDQHFLPSIRLRDMSVIRRQSSFMLKILFFIGQDIWRKIVHSTLMMLEHGWNITSDRYAWRHTDHQSEYHWHTPILIYNHINIRSIQAKLFINVAIIKCFVITWTRHEKHLGCAQRVEVNELCNFSFIQSQ